MEGKDEFQIRLNDLPEISKQELMEMRQRELDKPYNLKGNATANTGIFFIRRCVYK